MAYQCESCGAGIGGGFFGTKQASEAEIGELRKIVPDCGKTLCLTCYYKIKRNAEEQQDADAAGEPRLSRTEKRKKLDELIKTVVVVTYPPDASIEYEYCGIVSGYSAMGTGMFSDLFSSFTDFFGEQSHTYRKKFQTAENFCMDMLRLQALSKGGNLVAGTHFTYTELTAGKGQILVGATGTALREKACAVDIKGQYKYLATWWRE
jgi:uncharacterized protein YbjQ (UPF0145 family)